MVGTPKQGKTKGVMRAYRALKRDEAALRRMKPARVFGKDAM